MSDYIVKKSVRLKAKPSEVWDALTNPEKTKQYFFNSAVYSDWKPGSDIVFKGRMFWIIPFEMKGTIVRAIPGEILEYKLANRDGSGSHVTDTLSFADGYTTLTIKDDVGDGEDAPKRYNRSLKGWDKILGGLKKFLEK